MARPGEEVASSSRLVGCSCRSSRSHHCSCVWSWPPPSPPVVDNGFGLRDPGADGVFFKTVRVLQHQQFFTHRNWCRFEVVRIRGNRQLKVTSSAADKKLENKLEIYKNLEFKLEIYSHFKLENKLEIFEFFVNGR